MAKRNRKKFTDVDEMYRAYQQEQVLLTEPMKNKREEAIMRARKRCKRFTKKIFCSSRELYLKRQELVKANSR